MKQKAERTTPYKTLAKLNSDQQIEYLLTGKVEAETLPERLVIRAKVIQMLAKVLPVKGEAYHHDIIELLLFAARPCTMALVNNDSQFFQQIASGLKKKRELRMNPDVDIYLSLRGEPEPINIEEFCRKLTSTRGIAVEPARARRMANALGKKTRSRRKKDDRLAP